MTKCGRSILASSRIRRLLPNAPKSSPVILFFPEGGPNLDAGFVFVSLVSLLNDLTWSWGYVTSSVTGPLASDASYKEPYVLALLRYLKLKLVSETVVLPKQWYTHSLRGRPRLETVQLVSVISSTVVTQVLSP